MAGKTWTRFGNGRFFLLSPAGVPVFRVRQFNTTRGRVALARINESGQIAMKEDDLLYLLTHGWALGVQYRTSGHIRTLPSWPVQTPAWKATYQPPVAKVTPSRSFAVRVGMPFDRSIGYADHLKRVRPEA